MTHRDVLERAVLLALHREWLHHNILLFERALNPPLLELSDGTTPLGRWRAADRLISISRQLVDHHPWLSVVEVLKHEMAHQYVHEHLKVYDETAHGSAFQALCRRLRIDPGAAGIPTHGTAGVVTPDEERILRRVEKLLVLAQSLHVHEAQAAMQAARDMLVKHNLDHVPAAGGDRYVVKQLGSPQARVGAHERILSAVIVNHFFVHGIWVQAFDVHRAVHGQVLEVMGTQANVEVAAYVHAFLIHTSNRLYEQDREEHGSGRHRSRFLAAVMRGFQGKLNQSTHTEHRNALTRVMDAGLRDYSEARHPSVRRTTYRTAGRNDVDLRGEAAGRNIVLNKGVDAGTGERGRLLKG
jgi:hypothetical protein